VIDTAHDVKEAGLNALQTELHLREIPETGDTQMMTLRT
jgi:hypothetical protein